MADPFLELHVGGDLVVGNMSRAFHHHLYPFGPGTLGQFAQVQQFLDLGPVGGVCQAAGPQPSPRLMVTSYLAQMSRISS